MMKTVSPPNFVILWKKHTLIHIPMLTLVMEIMNKSQELKLDTLPGFTKFMCSQMRKNNDSCLIQLEDLALSSSRYILFMKFGYHVYCFKKKSTRKSINSTWSIFRCFFQATSRELDGKWISWDMMNWHPYGMLASQAAALPTPCYNSSHNL